MASTSSTPTFEEVDKHIQAADLSALPAGAKGAVAPAAAIPNVCAIYKIIRPFLLLASGFPIPQKWKDAIKLFIKAMDALCP